MEKLSWCHRCLAIASANDAGRWQARTRATDTSRGAPGAILLPCRRSLTPGAALSATDPLDGRRAPVKPKPLRGGAGARLDRHRTTEGPAATKAAPPHDHRPNSRDPAARA